ncbi:6,7-dimethyl-8-ribityllumazine synthase [bacterium]|nr:6,7-dimethyl-8-ribityllumazine synthase [bacterium]MCP5462409.1 6,7-dimethyl-8-ribityllumazine synthase [bacterium]
MRVIEGSLLSENKTYAVIVSRFNSFITTQLLEGALDTFKRHMVKDADITLFYVPGSFEIPVTAKKIAQTKKFDAIVCLGALIRGNTPHFDYISSCVSSGIGQIALEYSIPIIFGVLTVNTIEQAIERAGTKAGNKGAEAAQCAIEMASLFSHEF